jgi:asparagine synthase (glutamine-hydrolysing)
MCGICGSLSLTGGLNQGTAAISQLMRLMKRRGPDDAGLWTDERYCALGFQRLSILDLSATGHQPMTTSDSRYAIVYNGEVYNFRDLREDLCRRGLQFRSTGDTEVVLYALAEWGREALNRFNGMFALAVYDSVEKRLLLARDHAGIKPLYYLLTSKGLVFASQYDQIMSHPWASGLGVSKEALGLYLRLGYIPAPYALLQNTHMLEPGSWLEVTARGQIQRGKFFEFPVSKHPDLSGQEAYEAVDEAITRAVRRHLVSDVPLGTFLSGGIDSPLVAAKASASNNGAVRAFTVSTGDDLDESVDASAYAKEIGLEHIVERATPEMALAMLDDVITACGEPFADYSVFPTMLIARIARQHVKVILSGDGGDELFWGYPSRFVPPVKYSAEFRQPQWLRTLRWAADRVATRNFRYDLRYRSIGEYYRAAHCRIDDRTLASIFGDVPPWPNEFKLFDYTGCEPEAAAQWLRWNEFVSHLTMVLLKVDRASMHHSLEVRVPLLDREVVDVACRVDWHSCLDLVHNVGKLPLRYALARHIGRQTHVKRGFEVPMDQWLKGPLKHTFQEAVIERPEILGMELNRRKVKSMMQEHTGGLRDYTRSLWTLLSLALWEKKHYRTRNNFVDGNHCMVETAATLH